MNENLRGAGWMVLAMMAFAVEDALFKTATGRAGLTPGMATFLFGVIALTIFGSIAKLRGIALWNPAYLTRPLILRTLTETMGRLFFALSLVYNTLTITSTVLQAAPIIVTLGAVLLFGERAGPRRWIATCVGMLGVLLVLRPVPSQFDPAVILAVLGMLGFALRDLATRAAPAQVQPAQLGLLGFAVVTAAGLVIMAFDPAPPRLPGLPGAGMLVLTGIAGVIAYDALTRAMRLGDVSATAPFRYSRLVAAMLIGMLVFDERPDAVTWIGAALIVGAGLFTLWREQAKPAKAQAGAGQHKERT